MAYQQNGSERHGCKTTRTTSAAAKELDGGTITSLDEALPLADIVVWFASMPKTIEIDSDNLKNHV